MIDYIGKNKTMAFLLIEEGLAEPEGKVKRGIILKSLPNHK